MPAEEPGIRPAARKLPVAKPFSVAEAPSAAQSGAAEGTDFPRQRSEDTQARSAWAEKIDAACDAFEDAWRSGRRLALAAALEGWPAAVQGPLFLHLLELELDYRRRAGEQPTAEAYLAAHPGFLAAIEHCFAARPRQPLLGGEQGLKRLGEYDLLEKIGEGGMGAVFRARHRRMDRLVALKVLSPEVVGTPQALERFHREVRTLSRLSHPHIVAAYDAGEDQGVSYLVMEYVAGQDLATLLRERGPLPVRQAVQLVLQAATGLHYAHEQGIIHRDIKPSNLLLDERGNVRILDLGLARSTEGDGLPTASELTHSQQLLGTVDYLSPEQAANSRTVDLRTDIYSLGCTLYRLLTGKIPYDAETFVERIVAHREQPIPSLVAARGDIPPALEALYQRMVAKKPEDRPASLAEVLPVLQTLLLAPSAAGAGAGGRNVGAASAAASRRLVWWAAGAALLLCVIAGWMLVAGGRGKPRTIAASASGGAQREPGKTSPAPARPVAPSRSAPPLAVYPLAQEEAQALQQAWAEFEQAKVTVASRTLGLELQLVPPGKFRMGSSPEQLQAALEEATREELPSHYIDYIRSEADLGEKQVATAFYLGQTEVTVGQFRRFAEDKNYRTTAESTGLGGFHVALRQQQASVNWRTPSLPQGDDHPVVQVTLADALAFCEWLSAKDGEKYFLPNETQWEFACRAGAMTPWICGDDPARLGEYAWYVENSDMVTHPVGGRKPNAFGLYDMHGNVREWTTTLAATLDSHILRGGEFLKSALLQRSAMRIAFRTTTPYPYHGFRVAREIGGR